MGRGRRQMATATLARPCYRRQREGTTMEIRIDSLLCGAERASGTVVIIDVFRAFTTAAVALARGAAKIVMVSSVAEALALRSAGVGQLCMGEVQGCAPPGFDLGNSPFAASQAHVNGMTIIQRTSAGTQGVVSARHADQLYSGSLVTANATARAILRHAPQRTTLVAMGDMESLAATKTSCVPFICAIYWKVGQATFKEFAKSSLQELVSRISTIEPNRIFIPATWKLRLTLTATTSPSALPKKMATGGVDGTLRETSSPLPNTGEPPGSA